MNERELESIRQYREKFPDNRNDIEGVKHQVRFVQVRMLRIIDEVLKKNGIEYFLFDGTLLGARRHGGFIPWDDDIDIAIMRKDVKRAVEVLKRDLPFDMLVQYWEEKGSQLNLPFIKINDKFSSFIEKPFDLRYHQGIFIDIFPIDKVYKDKRLRDIQQKACRYLFYMYFDRPRHAISRKKLKYIIFKLFHRVENITRRVKFIIDEVDSNHSEYVYAHTLGWDLDFTRFEYTDEMLFPLTTIHFEGYEFPAPHDIDEVLKRTYGEWKVLPQIKYDDATFFHARGNVSALEKFPHKDSLEWGAVELLLK